MSSVLEKIDKLLELLKAAGVTNVLPSINAKPLSPIKPPKPPKAVIAATKISAGVSPSSNKNPTKQIQQKIKDPKIKDQKMQEAQAQLSLSIKTEVIDINGVTGQWTILEKSYPFGKHECPLKDGEEDSKYDPEQLEAGIKVEMEHTKDRETAKKIAKVHLDESPKYYIHLKSMENKMDKE